MSALHPGFRAAVYGSASNVGPDFVQVSPLPDDVWIALANAEVTVWGIGYGLNDSAWANGQRLHQFTGGHTEMWGGGVALSVDDDIEDGDVVVGNGTKSYSFTTQKEDVAGAKSTQPWAMNAGGPMGAIGDIVGYYLDSNINSHGFYDISGTPVSFDCTGAVSTSAYGINNFREIVGGYVTTNPNTNHGFSYSIGGTCTTIDYPGAASTIAYGINDAGWITGTYNDASGKTHGFLDKNGQFSSFDYPGGSNSSPSAIDGLGRIVGNFCADPPTCASITGFLDNAGSSDPSTGTFAAIAYPSAYSTQPYSINNNGQVTGQGNVNSSGVYTTYDFLFYNGSFTSLDQLIPSLYAVASINDQAQIVGISSQVDGLVAFPQH